MAHITPKFSGKISRGEVVLDEPKRFKLHCCGFKEGTEVEMIVRKPSKARSSRQNAYYWGVVIEIIHTETGEDRDAIHGILSKKFLTRTGWQGNSYVLSTARLSTTEFEQYLESCRQWAAIVLERYIPLPKEVDIPEYYIQCA